MYVLIVYLFSSLIFVSYISGAPVHDEIATTANCEFFANLINQTKHDNVQAKMLELIQTWSFAFRSQSKYQAVKV